MRKDTRYIKEFQKSLSNEKGMTLIDVAIALVVIGLLITPALYAMQQYRVQSVEQTTSRNIAIVNNAIEDYYVNNKFYPCPADPTLSADDANHGVSDTTAGVCDQMPGAAPVAEGAVPHTELGISIDNTYDGWGNKITYAVTSNLAGSIADPPAAMGTVGVITINDIPLVPNPDMPPLIRENICADQLAPYPPAPLPVATTAADYPPLPNNVAGIHYTLLSHGMDGVGAFNDQGNMVQACTAGTAADIENCDLAADGAVAMYMTAICRTNESVGINRFDDIIINGATASDKRSFPTDLFEEAELAAGNQGATVQYVGVKNFDPRFPLDIIGNLKTTTELVDPIVNGTAQATDFCDEDGDDCFRAALIGGSDPLMNCPTGSGMVNIGNNRAKCQRKIPEVTATTCPSGEYLRAIVGGVPQCGP